MARKARSIATVVHGLPKSWKACLKTSLYKGDDKTSCGEFGAAVLNFENSEDTVITAEDLEFEVNAAFKADESVGRVQIEFYTQKEGVWKQTTSVNCSRDDFEVKAERPAYNPTDPNTLIHGYLSLCQTCAETGKKPPDYEQYVKLHNETLKLTNQGKAEPISTSLVNLALRREEKTLERLAKREAELDAVSDTMHKNKDSQLAFLAGLHEKAQARADMLADKVAKNPVAEAIREGLVGAATIVEKLANANPGSPVDRMVSSALIAMSEKDPAVIADKVSKIAAPVQREQN